MAWMERYEETVVAAASPAGSVTVVQHRLLGVRHLLLQTDEATLERLLPALRGLAKASPSGVAPYLDAGMAPRPYLLAAMPAGGTLDDRLRAALPLPFLSVARWLEPLLRSLLELHDAGLLHGNVSAASIGFDGEGRPHWLLPTLLVPGAQLTAEAAALLPPEVVAGDAPYDAAADLAGLASLALCAVWGRFREGETHAFALLPGIPQSLAAQLDLLRVHPAPATAPRVALSLLSDWLEALDVGVEAPVGETHDDSVPLPVPSAERALSMAATASHSALASMSNHAASEEVAVAASPKTSAFTVAQVKGGFDTSAGLALPRPSALVSAARPPVPAAPDLRVESEEAAKALAALQAARKLFDL